MPTGIQHRRQVAHNEAFIASLDLDTTPFLDWVVTAIFYIALHEVDAYLARFGIDPKNHAEREQLTRQMLLPIYASYRFLKHQSINARYNVTHLDPVTAFTPSFVRSLVTTHLAAIRTHITSLP